MYESLAQKRFKYIKAPIISQDVNNWTSDTAELLVSHIYKISQTAADLASFRLNQLPNSQKKSEKEF